MRYVLAISALALVAACGSKTSTTGAATAPPAPTIDASSPDLALKSWWRVRDYENALTAEHCKRSVEWRTAGVYRKAMEKIATGPALNEAVDVPGLCDVQVYARSIIEVKVESDTRAVAIASVKQATPPPASAVMTASDVQAREKGGRYKYVLERVGKDWRIAEVYEFSEYAAGGDPWRAQTQAVVGPVVHTSVYGIQ